MDTKLNLISARARRNKREKFNNLIHLVNETSLRECFYMLDKDKAAGVDGVSVEEYHRDLDNNLAKLIRQMKRMSYRPQAVKRVYIPKSNGKQRPLGIPTVEDKMVQLCFTRILEAIYEEDFLDFSYGFRPKRNCHKAIKSLNDEIYGKRVNYLIDADIKGFFDNVSHRWMIEFIEHRISDKKFIRYIARFLKSGIEEKGKRLETETGTPQGGVISPVLANIYLHYVLDLWMERKVIKESRGYVSVVRYADDFVICVENLSEAETILEQLRERLGKFSLELSAEKTKIVKFGRKWLRDNQQETQEAGMNFCKTFDFLGFTHFMSQTRKGSFKVGRKTSSKRFSNSLRALKEEVKRLKDYAPIEVIWKKTSQKLTGHYSYYGISDNWRSLSNYYFNVKRILYKWLNRRSQKKSYNWETFYRILKRYPLPKPRIFYRMY